MGIFLSKYFLYNNVNKEKNTHCLEIGPGRDLSEISVYRDNIDKFINELVFVNKAREYNREIIYEMYKIDKNFKGFPDKCPRITGNKLTLVMYNYAGSSLLFAINNLELNHDI